MFTEIIKFGVFIGDIDIAIVVCRLYRDALAPSTKSTYKTGVRHLQRFKQKYPKAPFPSDVFNPPSKVSISLAFFTAYLFELESIKSHSTIRNYLTHAKQFYVKKGYPKDKLESPLFKAVMRGVKRCLPQSPDCRIAFLLVHYQLPRKMIKSRQVTIQKSIAAMSFGFFAMLRFHSYGKFCRKNLTLVLTGGKEVAPSNLSIKILTKLLVSNAVTGFYFTFDDKFHPRARAYFCKVGDLHQRLMAICPISQLITVLKLSPNDIFFPPSEVTRLILTKNMQKLTCIQRNVKPHSLRIGGHTFYTVYGLDSDFRDYLARRKVNKATSTYYRASPYLTIYKLRQFFRRVFN